MTEERLEHLIVRVVDELATAAERQELLHHAMNHPEVRNELERQQALKALTDGWVQRLQHDVAAERVAQQLPYRAATQIGPAALLAAVAVLTVGASYEALRDPTAPAWLSLGLALLIGGSVTTFAATLWRRLSTLPADRYTEIHR
jgi:hypothetical protein